MAHGDFEQWARDHIPAHVDSLADRMLAAALDNPPERIRRGQGRWWVEVAKGNLVEESLCWVCASARTGSMGVFVSRACERCQGHDRRLAAGLGVAGILPLLGRQVAPVSDSVPPPALRRVLDEIAADTAQLDAWRRRLVTIVAEEMGRSQSRFISYTRWVEALPQDEEWSRACWQQFLGIHHPLFSPLAMEFICFGEGG